jgi:hypothetical protein
MLRRKALERPMAAKRWEYKCRIELEYEAIEEWNKLGREGWELVTIVTGEKIGGWWALQGYFKREIEEIKG